MLQTDKALLLATFEIRDTLYALDAGGIQEVIRLAPVTKVRHAPAEVAGVINLRGRIVTVLDLGLMLGREPIVTMPGTRIFIIEDRGESVGLLVDCVHDVIEVEAADWQPTPPNLTGVQTRWLRGVCRSGEQLITVLDAERIVSGAAV